jgi:hypothetical protein
MARTRKESDDSVQMMEGTSIPYRVSLANFFHSWVYLPMLLVFLPLLLILTLAAILKIQTPFIPQIGILYFGFLFGSLILSMMLTLLFPDQAYPTVKKWILENVRCPKCKGKLKTCYVPASTPSFFIVRCSKCNKETRFLHWTIAFDRAHLTIADDDKYVWTWPYRSQLIRLLILSFCMFLMILLIIFTVYYFFNPPS